MEISQLCLTVYKQLNVYSSQHNNYVEPEYPLKLCTDKLSYMWLKWFIYTEVAQFKKLLTISKSHFNFNTNWVDMNLFHIFWFLKKSVPISTDLCTHATLYIILIKHQIRRQTCDVCFHLSDFRISNETCLSHSNQWNYTCWHSTWKSWPLFLQSERVWKSSLHQVALQWMLNVMREHWNAVNDKSWRN